MSSTPRARCGRRKLGCRPVGWLGVVLVFTQVTHGVAQSPPQPAPVRVHLSVEADPQCATPAAIAEQVHARSQRIEFVSDTGDVPRLRVTIRVGSARDRVAELVLEWPDGRHSKRSLNAAGCPAAIDALALLVVMTLDPAAFHDTSTSTGASASETTGPSTTDSGMGTGTGTGTNSDSESDSESATSTSTSTSTATAAAAAAATATPSAPPPLGLSHFAAGASGHLLSGPAPRLMPGAGLYARLSFNGAGPWWAPALELRLVHAWVDGLSEPGGDADFALDFAELDVCPLGVQLEPFAAHACLASAIGRLSADGSNSYAPQDHDELWASVGGDLLLSVRLVGPVELQAGFGLQAPLRRYQFSFQPDVFHRVPKLCPEGHFGAGVRFP